MTDHQSQASAPQQFVLRRRPSSYHSADAHSREEAKRGAIAAVLGSTESFNGKYHYGLFANGTQSLSDAQAAFTHRLVELVCAQLAHEAVAGEFRIGIDGASLASFASEMKQAQHAHENPAPIEIIAVGVVGETPTASAANIEASAVSEKMDCLLVEGSYRSIDQLGVFSRARRLLKPGGLLIVFGEFLNDDSAVEHSPLPNLSSLIQLAERLNYSIAVAEDHTQSALRSIELFAKQAQLNAFGNENETLTLVRDELDRAAQELASGKRVFKFYTFTKGLAPAESDSEYAAAEYGDRASFQPAAVADLFERSFGHAFDAEVWHWKYELGAGRCVVARANAEGDLVAHYGGAPRDICYFGRPALAIQPCDVMVMPEERTRYGRGSLFFKVAATFLEREIGNTVDHLLGFGFPNKKTMRLAIRLGLYEKTDDFVEVRVSGITEPGSAVEAAWTLADFDAADSAQRDELGALWQEMQVDFENGIIGVRDWEYISYRYLQHPHRARYSLRWLRDSAGRAMALCVIKRSADAWLLMDIVAPLATVSRALTVLARALVKGAREEPFCTQVGENEPPSDLLLWLTKGWLARLDMPNAAVRDLGIEIPCNSWNPGPAASLLYGKWWLTAGDMDFQ
jgi:hypothetical protein